MTGIIKAAVILAIAVVWMTACSESPDKVDTPSENLPSNVSQSGPLNTLDEADPELLYHSQAPVTPELAKRGGLQVGVSTLTATNPEQLSTSDFSSLLDRVLTLEVWYPAKKAENAKLTTYIDQTRSGKTFELQGQSYRDAEVIKTDREYPLVVLSHGYTGYRTMMFYLAEHLASHGYVVAALDHTDSTNAEVDFVNSPFSGFPSTLLNRARDQQFVLEYFAKLDTPLGKSIAVDQASVIGYSMGGYGAINTVGGCYNYSEALMLQFGFPEAVIPALLPVFNTCNAGQDQVDTHWKAMIAFAPWGGEQGVHSSESLKNISVPVLYVAGEFDDISGYESGVKKLFKQTGSVSSDHTYLMVYENARHNIAAHPAPKVAFDTELDIGHYFEPSWDSVTLNRINEHMSLAFLDCHVKKKMQACAYLPQRQDITQHKQSDGTMSAPWPGFQDRWGTGVKFYRKN